jgi:hypothetical protein
VDVVRLGDLLDCEVAAVDVLVHDLGAYVGFQFAGALRSCPGLELRGFKPRWLADFFSDWRSGSHP